MRQCELLALRWPDVDLEGGSITSATRSSAARGPWPSRRGPGPSRGPGRPQGHDAAARASTAAAGGTPGRWRPLARSVQPPARTGGPEQRDLVHGQDAFSSSGRLAGQACGCHCRKDRRRSRQPLHSAWPLRSCHVDGADRIVPVTAESLAPTRLTNLDTSGSGPRQGRAADATFSGSHGGSHVTCTTCRERVGLRPQTPRPRS
jgi:hypothetical protein